MSKQFIIKDWANNEIAPGETFESFEDGWSWIYENIQDEEMFQDLYIEEVES